MTAVRKNMKPERFRDPQEEKFCGATSPSQEGKIARINANTRIESDSSGALRDGRMIKQIPPIGE
jgi:hypothetical protein